MQYITAMFFYHCCLLTTVAAQSPIKKTDDWKKIFSYNHLSFSIMTGVAEKALVESDLKRFGLMATPKIAVGGGVSYVYHLNKNFSLSAGFHFAIPVRNLKFHVPSEAMNPDRGYPLSSYDASSFREGLFLSRLPVSLETRWFTSPKKFWQLYAGASLVYFVLNELELGYFITGDNGQPHQAFNMVLTKVTGSRPWFNYHFGAGRGLMLRNKDLLTIGVAAHLSNTYFWKGPFTLSPPGVTPITGTYSFRGSYAGLTVNYTMTDMNKKWKRPPKK